MNQARAVGNRKTLVLGLGNDILTDDAIGLLVVRELAQRFQSHPELDFQETSEMGLALLDFMEGRDVVVVVDSVQTGEVNPGTLREIDPASLGRLAQPTPHFLGVGETLALGAELGLRMPHRVRVFGIEVADPFTIGNTLTPALQAALPSLVSHLSRELLADLSSPAVPPFLAPPSSRPESRPPAG